jgi:hypothetical protein
MKPKSTIEMIREAQAAQSARWTYALAHDHFSDLEQQLVGEGRITEATGAHEFALIALKAYRAELDDPEPRP